MLDVERLAPMSFDPQSVVLPQPKGTRATLARYIYARLKTAILTNEYQPGQFLTESELAEAFATSKSPVRDALKLLQAERLVDAVDKRGYVITVLTPTDVKERLQVRQVLEVAAAELAVHNMTDTGLARLREMVSVVDDLAALNDQKGLLLHNRQFHAAIASLSGNSYLAELIERVHADLQRALFSDLSTSSFQDLKSEHEAIIDSLAGRDVVTAKQVAESHVEETRRRVLS